MNAKIVETLVFHTPSIGRRVEVHITRDSSGRYGVKSQYGQHIISGLTTIATARLMAHEVSSKWKFSHVEHASDELIRSES